MGGGRGGINFLPLKKGGLNRGFMVHTVEKSWCPQRKNAMYVVGLHGSLLPSFSDCWIVCTCCDTADSIRSSSLLNSSKQPQAPTWHRPTKIRPMAWKKKKSGKKRDCDDYYPTGCRNVRHCQQQQPYSGPRSPGRSNSTYLWKEPLLWWSNLSFCGASSCEDT